MDREFLKLLMQHEGIQDIPVLHIIKILVAIVEIDDDTKRRII